MDTEMNDIVSPSQSSPLMSGNAGQNKGNSGSENAAVVSFCFEMLFTFKIFVIFFLSFSQSRDFKNLCEKLTRTNSLTKKWRTAYFRLPTSLLKM